MHVKEKLRRVFEQGLTTEMKANIRRHLKNGVPVLAGDKAKFYSSIEGGL